MPGNRGFPGSDGLLGPKVSYHYYKKFLVDPDGTKGKETLLMCLKRAVMENEDHQDQLAQKGYPETLDAMVNRVWQELG